jgi:dTMP kinase
MDIGLSNDIRESFKLFQQRIMREYDAMIDEFGLTVIDGTRSIEEQQAEVRSIVKERLSVGCGTLTGRR